MFKLKNISKLPIITKDEGLSSRFQKAVLNESGDRLIGLTLQPSDNELTLFAPVELIHAIGKDAIILKELPTTSDKTSYNYPPINKTVYRVDGTLLGKIGDLLIDSDYTLLAYLLNTRLMIPPSALNLSNKRYIINEGALLLPPVITPITPKAKPSTKNKTKSSKERLPKPNKTVSEVKVPKSSKINKKPETIQQDDIFNLQLEPLELETLSDTSHNDTASNDNPNITEPIEKKSDIINEAETISNAQPEMVELIPEEPNTNHQAETISNAQPEMVKLIPEEPNTNPQADIISNTQQEQPQPIEEQHDITVHTATADDTQSQNLSNATTLATGAATATITTSSVKPEPLHQGTGIYDNRQILLTALEQKLRLPSPRSKPLTTTGKQQKLKTLSSTKPTNTQASISAQQGTRTTGARLTRPNSQEFVPPTSQQTVTRIDVDLPNRIIADYSFLLGRISSTDIYAYSGDVIIPKDSLITVKSVLDAHAHNRLLDLTRHSKL